MLWITNCGISLNGRTMKLEISRREYQISRGRKVWTKHPLLSRIEATGPGGRWQYLANLALK